ncbi:MAG: methyl-accepting chemotaxis protein [Rhodoferax sp.]
MRFTDYKIRTWLAGAFGLLVLLSVLSGGLALRQLAGIQANLEVIVKENNVKIRLNNSLSESVHIVSRVMRTVALLEDKAAKDREMTKILKARADYARHWDEMLKFPASTEGQALRQKIGTARDTALPLNNKVLETDAAGKKAEAVAFLMSDAAPATERWQQAIDEYLVYQEKNNEQEYMQGQQDYTTARTMLIVSSLVTVLVAVALGIVITRGIVGALGAEPGQAAQLAQQVAAGDLSSSIPLRGGDTQSMMAQLKLMQDSLSRVVLNVRQNADSVATASAQIAQGNTDLSSRTEEQASALEQTAASMEQLGSTVRQNADNARQGNQLAQNASTVAVRGGEVVGQVVDTMKGINEASRKIADIIGVIDGIAFQTNILALNAAVEAARAGEQGRGFAVVASEVRSLAGRSAEAAKEIKSLISDSVQRVEQGTALVDQAGATMTEVVAAIRRVTDIMGEISAASSEQSQGVAQVGEAVTQMDQATQQNAALVEESAAAAESLKAQAQQLVQAVAVFKLAQGAAHGHALEAPAAAPRVAPKPAAKSFPAVERRGPQRSKNVTRIAPSRPGAAPAAAPKAEPPVLTTQAETRKAPAGGGEDDWTTF